MNHITGLAIARSIQHDRLESVRRTSHLPPIEAERPARPTHFGEMTRVLLMGFRQMPEPSR